VDDSWCHLGLASDWAEHRTSRVSFRPLDPSLVRQFGETVSQERTAEWLAFSQRIATDNTSAQVLTGNRPFWMSDYVAHSQREYLFTVHMFSKRTIPANCDNDEGKRNRHLSDGATALYIDGHEYDGIMPVWNYSRPSGTTVAKASARSNELKCKTAKHETDATFVGSVSDGTVGVAVQELIGAFGGKKDNEKWDSSLDANASKTWFFVPTAVLCVGDAKPQSGLVTTVEQALLQGEVLVSVGGEAAVPLPAESVRSLDLSSGSAWVAHHNSGYLLPQMSGAVAHVSTMTKNGSWSSIGSGGHLPPQDNVSIPVFDLWIEHEEQYSYTVLPAATPAAVAAAADKNQKPVGGRAEGYRAVVEKDGEEELLLAAVWSNASSTLVHAGDGWSVSSSRACAFIVRAAGNGTLIGTASVPGADGGQLVLTVEHASLAEQCEMTFELPTGDDSGRSVGGTCRAGGNAISI